MVVCSSHCLGPLLGPSAWALCTQVRGFALGVATLINRTTSGAVAVSFLSLTRALTAAGAYYLFAAIACLATVFIATRVPETKGKSLEAIETEMAERYGGLLTPTSTTPAPPSHAAVGAEADAVGTEFAGGGVSHSV